jgi:nitrogen regulatory protein PII
MAKHATKLVIITEMLLLEHLVRIASKAGATGYTVTAAEGKGTRNARSPRRPSVSDTYEKVRFEVLTLEESIARAIADEVAANYFDNFSGIAYIDRVEVLYAHSL